MAVSEKTVEAKTEHVDNVDVVERTHIDGTVDFIDTRAIGGDLDELPPGYFRSPQFIGTVVVRFIATKYLALSGKELTSTGNMYR